MGNAEDVEDQCDGNWFDADGGFIGARVGAQLSVDAEVSVTYFVFAGVRGPHAGELLADRSKRPLHCARLDTSPAGSELTVLVALGKYLENGDGVSPFPKERIHPVVGAELFPALPMPVTGVGRLRNDAGSDRFLNKAEVSAERMPFFR